MTENKRKTRTSNAVKDRWNSQAYDDLRIRIPKGQKATVQAAAEQANESVNEYTQNALLQHMGLAKWPVLEEQKKGDKVND